MEMINPIFIQYWCMYEILWYADQLIDIHSMGKTFQHNNRGVHVALEYLYLDMYYLS